MHIFLLTHTKQLLLVIFCDMTAGIGISKVGDDALTLLYEGTDLKVEIVM